MKGKMPSGGRKIDFKMLGRVVKLLFTCYPRLMPIVIVCMTLSAMVSASPAIFTQQIIDIVADALKKGQGWDVVGPQVIPLVLILLCLYVVSIILITVQTQLMAKITQGFLSKMRCKMFEGMQNLPIKYFDTHQHGDIMSYYTNDADALRQMLSQSIPQVIQSVLTIVFVFVSMLIHEKASVFTIAALISDNTEQIWKTYGHLYEEDKISVLSKII